MFAFFSEVETTCAREAARVCEPPCVVETPRVSAPVGVSDGVCVGEAQCVSERPGVGCVKVTACVRLLYTREMAVGMHEHVAASPDVSLNVICVRFESRGTREYECEACVETETTTVASQMPGSRCSCNRDRAGSAR